jgi:hypothetical protein
MQFAVTITMHVPLILVMQLKDVSSPKKIVQELTFVTLDLATATPENVSIPLLFVTITMHVPLMFVINQLEDANTLQRTVTTEMHVPLTVVTETLDCAHTLQRYVTTTTFAQKTLATPRLENVIMRMFLQL